MQIVQRIMNKLVGEEISMEQLEEVSGAQKDSCENGFRTFQGTDGTSAFAPCDYE